MLQRKDNYILYLSLSQHACGNMKRSHVTDLEEQAYPFWYH
jgi:hypothetical protein